MKSTLLEESYGWGHKKVEIIQRDNGSIYVWFIDGHSSVFIEEGQIRNISKAIETMKHG